MDFGKYKYELAKKAHESKKHQSVIVVKEIKMRPRTDDHDVQFKTNNIKRFLEEGNKVKVTVMFRGREMAHTTHGRALLERILADLQNEAAVEQPPRMEGRNMTMMLGARQRCNEGEAISRGSQTARRITIIDDPAERELRVDIQSNRAYQRTAESRKGESEWQRQNQKSK